MNNRLGIMLGRLSPPIKNNIQAFPYNSWENEFSQAKKLVLILLNGFLIQLIVTQSLIRQKSMK